VWDYPLNRIVGVAEITMKFRLWQKRSALFLLVAYTVDLVWKVANWHDVFGDVAWWGIALGLTIRFAFMGLLLFLYLRLRKVPQEPPVVTVAATSASLRSMRIIHIIMLAAIVSYLFLAERLPKPGADVPPVIVESFSVLAILMVVIAVACRRKLLPPAVENLRRDPTDGTALGRWRMANILSFVLSMAIALYGLALRALGGDRRVVWPFFIASLILMLLWAPRLDRGVSDAETSSPPRN
jgi:uncharacterized membrane protein